MTDESKHEIVIVKRRRGGGDESHHGGVWKIAFADFMTAMMAFFLVLWIVNSTSKETRSSIARYFNPIRLSDTTPARKGLREPKDSDFDASATQNEKSEGEHSKAPRDGGEGKRSSTDAGQMDGPDMRSTDRVEALCAPTGIGSGNFSACPKMAYASNIQRNEVPANGPDKTTFGEIATANSSGALRVPSFDSRRADDFIDPFESSMPTARSIILENSRVGRMASIDRLKAVESEAAPIDTSQSEIAREKALVSGQAISGGKTGSEPAGRTSELLAAHIDAALRSKLDGGLSSNLLGVKLTVKPDNNGVLVSLTDTLRFSMFRNGSATPNPLVKNLIAAISTTIADLPGNLIVRGHTDNHVFKKKRTDNWSLSIARARSAMTLLRIAGVPEDRFARLEGYGDKSPLNTGSPSGPENRRIEILLVTR